MLHEFELILTVKGRNLSHENKFLDFAEEVAETVNADVPVAVRDGVVSAMVTREAASFASAIEDSINEIERLEGVRVVCVGPDTLVTATEIAERMDLSRQAIQLMISSQRGPGGFPPPLIGLASRQRVWRWLDVVEWFGERYPNGSTERARAATLAKINLALDARRLGMLELWEMAASALTRIVLNPGPDESAISAARALRSALPMLKAMPELQAVAQQAEVALALHHP